MGYGSEIKKVRLDRRMSLREFCRQVAIDPSNWSKIEREVMPPPQDEDKLRDIAEVLDINPASDEYTRLRDLAFIDAGIIPKDILSDEETLNRLPIFFRTIRHKRPNEEQLKELVDIIRKGG
jgi:transcriptional regulator with XRE-family HTH domain